MKHIAPYLALLLFTSGLGFAEQPGWWTDPATGFIDPEANHSVVQNYAPANLGQLKKVASRAKTYLDANLSGGAGSAVNAMIAEWTSNADNYSPINLGQLKRVAKPFYDRLNAAGYSTRNNLIARGYPSSWAYTTPWDPTTPTSENYLAANLGQLKMAFSFDLSGFDGNTDGLPDIWRNKYFPSGGTGSGASDDPDGDGQTNAQEVAAGTNPLVNDHPAVHLTFRVIVK